MRRGRLTEEQIIGVLREREAGVKTVERFRLQAVYDASKHAVSGLMVSDA